MEFTTPGGDAVFARRPVLELQLTRRRLKRRLAFLGKTRVYSAGVTLMSALPREDRYLTADCSLLVHSRQLVERSHVSLEEVLDNALYNWYLTARQAVERGLVVGVIE